MRSLNATIMSLLLVSTSFGGEQSAEEILTEAFKASEHLTFTLQDIIDFKEKIKNKEYAAFTIKDVGRFSLQNKETLHLLPSLDDADFAEAINVFTEDFSEDEKKDFYKNFKIDFVRTNLKKTRHLTSADMTYSIILDYDITWAKDPITLYFINREANRIEQDKIYQAAKERESEELRQQMIREADERKKADQRQEDRRKQEEIEMEAMLEQHLEEIGLATTLNKIEAERLEAERLEAERLEAERLEAERLEAERREILKRNQESIQEAMRQEAMRQEAMRQEAMRQEAMRQEEERIAQEKERQEAMRRQYEEAMRQEAMRQEAMRQENMRRQQEAMRQEAMHQENMRKYREVYEETIRREQEEIRRKRETQTIWDNNLRSGMNTPLNLTTEDKHRFVTASTLADWNNFIARAAQAVANGGTLVYITKQENDNLRATQVTMHNGQFVPVNRIELTLHPDRLHRYFGEGNQKPNLVGTYALYKGQPKNQLLHLPELFIKA